MSRWYQLKEKLLHRIAIVFAGLGYAGEEEWHAVIALAPYPSKYTEK